MHTRPRDQSNSTLSSQPSEMTKKQIQDEQQLQCPYQIHNNRFIFSLSYLIQFSSIFPILTRIFHKKLLNIFQTPNRVQMLFHNPLHQGTSLSSLCCCFRPPLTEFIEVCYSKELIDHKSMLTVTNPTPTLNDDFILHYIQPINEELQKERGMVSESIWINSNLDTNSPLQLDIHIHKKIHHLIHTTLHTTYQQSVLKIATADATPSQLLQTIVTESECLMDEVQHLYDRKEESYLHSLLSTDTERQMALYCMEQALCVDLFKKVKQKYYECMREKCMQFNKECRRVKEENTNEECFEYMNLKEKYRLEQSSRPYGSAVEALTQIEYAYSFRMMLQCVQKMFSCMKMECLVAHAGKVELASMDEVLPVMIFVVMKAGVKDLPLYVRIVEDYANFKGTFELEDIIIKTLYATMEDISHKWKRK